jgi:hypothetical protein
MSLEDTIQNNPNKFGEKIKSGVIAARDYISKNYNTARAIATVTATSLLVGCVDPFSWCPEPDPTPNPDPIVIVEDPVEEPVVDPVVDPIIDDPVIDDPVDPVEEPSYEAPTINYNGPAEITKPLGDNHPDLSTSADINVIDGQGNSITYEIINPNFDIDGDGREDITTGDYIIRAIGPLEQTTELRIPGRTVYESSKLEDFLNMKTTMTKADGSKMTIEESLAFLEFDRAQGTHPPNIQGESEANGRLRTYTGATTTYGTVNIGYSEQDKLSINVSRGIAHPNSIITGNKDVGEYSVYFYEDHNNNGIMDRAYIETGEILLSGNSKEIIELYLVDKDITETRLWIKYSETNTPKSS